MARSPADVLRLVVAVVSLIALLAVEWLFGSAVIGFAHDLLRGLDAIDEDVLTTVVAVIRVACVGVLAFAAVRAIAAGRGRVALTAAVGGAAAAGLFALVDRFIDTQRAALAALTDSAGALTSEVFLTTTGLAVVAGVMTAAAPWLPRRYRRSGWFVALGLALTGFVASPVSAHVLAAVLCGWVGGAAAVVALGAPSCRPSAEAVTDGLRAVGVELADLHAASVDARGSTPYFGTTADGGRLFVKVLGRDERDADLLFRLYRFVVPRDLGDERPFSSLRRAVEHEALLSLAVTRLGVRTPPVVAFSPAAPDGFVLSYEAVAGRSLDRLEPDEVTDGVLADIWRQVGILRRSRVAHRDLRLANVFLDDGGEVWLIDFGFAELAASDLLLATDVAELVAALSLKVGAARAVGSGIANLGGGVLRTGLDRLQPRFLSGATRTALAGRPGLLEEVRQALTDAVPRPAVVPPAPAKP